MWYPVGLLPRSSYLIHHAVHSNEFQQRKGQQQGFPSDSDFYISCTHCTPISFCPRSRPSCRPSQRSGAMQCHSLHRNYERIDIKSFEQGGACKPSHRAPASAPEPGAVKAPKISQLTKMPPVLRWKCFLFLDLLSWF